MARKTSVPIPAAPLAPGYLLRFIDLRPYVRLSRQTVLALEQAGRFPRAVRFGPRCTLWRTADVIEWLADPEHYCAPWRKESSDGR
ncbi:MAG: AlpA family phage regulatory protein [Paraburkholderia tropica]|uniref:helix-turn-helix transcriptional regulator n=1 Tax=Paraburkholderia tropica TaxID=92647 RepID=UPI001611A122|nr:AlpA family phage regulatory protein [Paraburkholderia tropica]MBB2984586.1 putative DNA-binding transcriptional regulator AlpA [Paraburkholderia tropica]